MPDERLEALKSVYAKNRKKIITQNPSKPIKHDNILQIRHR